MKTVAFTLTIFSGDAALSDDPAHELARILRDTAEAVAANGGESFTRDLRDYNGRKVGAFTLEIETPEPEPVFVVRDADGDTAAGPFETVEDARESAYELRKEQLDELYEGDPAGRELAAFNDSPFTVTAAPRNLCPYCENERPGENPAGENVCCNVAWSKGGDA
jgi:hypothetical protein